MKTLTAIAAAAAATLLSSTAFAANVVNGNFESGNTGFSSSYGYVAPAGQSSLYPEGVYTVGANPNAVHNLWGSFGDHTTGSGQMMIVNGATVPGVTVWDQIISGLTADTTYYFSAWVASSHPDSPAVLDFSINGSAIGGLAATSTVGAWTQFYATWNSGSNTSARIALVNQNTAYQGNDFALDDIAFGTTNPGAVPEPATWAMMIGGFAAAGSMVRRQRRALALA